MPAQRSDSPTRREVLKNATLLGAAVAFGPWIDRLNARADASAGRLSLGNEWISGTWDASPGGGLRLLRLEDRRTGKAIASPVGAFDLTFADQSRLDAARMRIMSPPRIEELRGDPHASRLAERLDGRRIVVELEAPERHLKVTWRAVLRDGSHYLRQELTLQAAGGDVPVAEVCLVDVRMPGASVSGTVKGSPVTAGPWFFGLEHPLSASSAGGERVRCTFTQTLPIKDGQSAELSAVIGIARPGQMRRDFLRYVERERAHPYRTFLHYNSWYDIGYFSPFDEAAALDVIETFGRELHMQRGVILDSFLFDDGWDDHKLWGFNSGFPHGFTPLRDAAARYGSAPGVWLSPWGGYGKPRAERLLFGKEQKFETNEEGFALSGPVYYRRFREVCLDMVRRYGVNQFKIDGTGSTGTVIPGSDFGSDFEAAIRLMSDLRAEKPDLYINLTTGTYPSPFWLRTADSIWRGGEDHEFTGVGSDRQRWITYRDADTFQGVVEPGPLFPLNSLMLHGLIYARHAKNLSTDPQGDFRSEIRSYFGTGTQLQEMYVSPSLLTASNWDDLAEAALWSRRNAATLVDTHWIGGHPGRLEVYGWAAWSPGHGILTLRNPGDTAQTVDLDPAEVWELPPDAPGRFTVHSPWKDQTAMAPRELHAGKTERFTLQPFDVLTLETR
ncbi:MAG TPA: twin-arginine translocation signal domain-containing protein [Thermoanaerobaculia bacterium]|jgi:hypothetical protein|nr:twin-arginine translocation signal domain-containing protein [Thermoanaerobaculia bacterium]